MARFTKFRAYLRSPFKTPTTTTSSASSKAIRIRNPPPRPIDLAMNEPIMSTFDPNPPASPINQDFPHATITPQSPFQPSTTNNITDTNDQKNEPRVFTINITNLAPQSAPLPSSPASQKKPANPLLRTRSRSQRRLSIRISKLNPSKGIPVPPVPLTTPRPNSYFGTGFDIPISELEKVVEEVNEMSLRHARKSKEFEELGGDEWRGVRVAYVPL